MTRSSNTSLHKAFVFAAITACLLPFLVLNSTAGSLETIQTKVAQFLKRPGVRSADWGIEILDPTTNKVLVAVNPDKTFKPASVLKVITTSAALERLGADFQFHTRVYTDGTLSSDGELLGDVILVGRGDPNLTDPYQDLMEKPALQELSEKMRALGITKIRGDVIGDDSYFDASAYGKGWTARDLKSISGAPISALSINNNVFWILARATKANQLVSVSVEPHTNYFHIRNLGITGGARSKRTLYARVIRGTNRLVVSGILPLGQGHSQSILLDNPAEVAAAMFKEEMQRRGISITGGLGAYHRGDYSPATRRQWKMLAEYDSPPLIRALEIINKRSQNLHAEMLLRTLGAEFGGDGSDEAGLGVVRDFLVGAGLQDSKINLKDGCGLSRDNLVTPRFQTSLLTFLSNRPYFEIFLNTLAVSGTDGTLKHRLASYQVKGSIHAKTGTLNGVTNLSGYMTTKSGHNLVFTILTNNQRASTGRIKKTIDEICALFVNLY